MCARGIITWTDCLDKPCVIDPINSNQATCTCSIKYSKNFLTFGGQCKTASCDTTLYSGASIEMLSQGTQIMVKGFKFNENRQCEICSR